MKFSNLFSILTFLFSSSLYSLFNYGFISERNTFLFLTLTLLFFLILMIVNYVKSNPYLWLLNPIVLCSILLFGLSYTISNFLFFITNDDIENLGIIPEITHAMVKLMFLIILGAVSMWLGYYSFITKLIFTSKNVKKFNLNFIDHSNNIRTYILPTFIILSTFSRILQMQLGIFGFSTVSYDNLVSSSSYSLYLTMGASLGKASLLLISIQHYKANTSVNSKKWLYALLVIEIFWGLLSGFKSQVVLPFLIVVLSSYLATSKFKIVWLLYVSILLVLAYSIIEPYRLYKLNNQEFEKESITDIVYGISESRDSNLEENINKAPILLAILSRSNLTWIGSIGIDYKDKGLFSLLHPEFLSNILLAPLHAWVPRFIWKTKPINNLGLWYNSEVIGISNHSSVGMGPITYLYFAGGYITVFLGFFFVGIVHKFAYLFFNPTKSVPAAFLYLAIVSMVSNIDSAFNTFIVSLFRDIPILLLIGHIIFIPNKRIKVLKN